MEIIKEVKKFLGIEPKLIREVFEANLNKLPKGIKVGWFRDGDFIIGEILADGHKFITQAKSAEEFVEMVNDTILSVYEIPEDYINIILKNRAYKPKKEEFEKLDNIAIKKSSFSSERVLKELFEYSGA